MDEKAFEELLSQPESNWLDFKREQYKFHDKVRPPKAGKEFIDGEKSEFIKDVIGFANAELDRDAFIVIGVKKTGNRTDFHPIQPDHQFDDAELQAIVHSKTNKRAEFHYVPISYRGGEYAVVRVPPRQGLFWLEDDFGKLRKLLLYVRIGTRIEPVTPGEIFDRGAGSVERPVPSFRVELVRWPDKTLLGKRTAVNLTLLNPPDIIPEVPRAGGKGLSGVAAMLSENSPFNQKNYNYLSDLALYRLGTTNFRPFAIGITNTGGTTGTNVHFELTVTDENVLVHPEDNMPDPPKLRTDPRMRSLADIIHKNKTGLSVEANREEGVFRLSCGPHDIQPKKTIVVGPPFYICCASAKTVHLTGALYGDQLADPFRVELEFVFEVECREMTVDELWQEYREALNAERESGKDD